MEQASTAAKLELLTFAVIKSSTQKKLLIDVIGSSGVSFSSFSE